MKLREYLKTNNLTQKEFSKIIGVYPKYINDICIDDGRRVPDHVISKIEQFGVVYDNPTIKPRPKKSHICPFDYFKSMLQLEFNKGQKKNSGILYCMNKEELNYAIKKMNKLNIMFYSYYKEGYYIVNWEREDYIV